MIGEESDMLIGIGIGFAAGIGTAIYAPRVWAYIVAAAKRRIDKIGDDIGTGTGL